MNTHITNDGYPRNHHCVSKSGQRHVVRVLTGRIIYRLSSKRNDPNGGRHVWCRPVLATKLGARKLINLHSLLEQTELTTCVGGIVS